MNYTIGFDLGTHQTKICIQDSSNAAEKIYEFLEFEKPDGTTTVLFPSIVQINIDETVSYGYADESKCLQLKEKELEEPTFHPKDMPVEPIIPVKKKAKYTKKPLADPWKDTLLKLKGVKSVTELWKEECENIDNKIETEWNTLCQKLLSDYNKECSQVQSENSNAYEKYNQNMAEWEKSQMKKQPCCFRYFKLRAFTDKGSWASSIFDAKEITIWYIAYILILLKEKLGDKDIPIQFGAPVGATGLPSDKLITERAYSLYIAAYDLANGYDSIDDYKSATYLELRSKTNIRNVDEDIINQYIFDDIPEAFAGLIAVTTKKRLGSGFHILADIGGGTTDMAMFYIDYETNLPDVISIDSFPIGLNYVLEKAQETTNKSIEALQDQFFIDPTNIVFRQAVSEYKEVFKKYGRDLQNRLFQSFDDSRVYHGKGRSELERVIRNKPIVYCGGGSVYPSLQSEIEFFTDKQKIDKELLSIRNIRNEKNIPKQLYPILAISYGLASYEKDPDIGIKCTDISVVFRKCLPPVTRSYNEKDYDLLDD